MDRMASQSARSALLSSPPIPTEIAVTIPIVCGSTRSPGSGGGSRPSGLAPLEPMAKLILASFTWRSTFTKPGGR